MTDRELLEKAANAAGNGAKWVCTPYEQTFKVPYRTEHASGWMSWNPLTNDSDAFRLMVKLGIDLQFTATRGEVVASFHDVEAVECNTADEAAATRRAITRAAAALQEAKESK